MGIIIQISLKQIIISATIIALCMTLLQWLLALWIKNRLEKSIQHEYDKKLEDYRFSQLQRQKAEILAQFFAKWVKFRAKEKELLDEKQLIEYYEELNRMSLEISLWISDVDVLNDIMSLCERKDGATDLRSLVGKVRKIMLNKKDDNFEAKNIVLWP